MIPGAPTLSAFMCGIFKEKQIEMALSSITQIVPETEVALFEPSPCLAEGSSYVPTAFQVSKTFPTQMKSICKSETKS